MSLKIILFSTRGFQLIGGRKYAEILKSLVEIGHDVCVFNPHTRKVKESQVYSVEKVCI